MTIKRSPFWTTKVSRCVRSKPRCFRKHVPSKMSVALWRYHYTDNDSDGLMLDMFCARFGAKQKSRNLKLHMESKSILVHSVFCKGPWNIRNTTVMSVIGTIMRKISSIFITRCVTMRRECTLAVSICMPWRLLCFKDWLVGTRKGVLLIIKVKLKVLSKEAGYKHGQSWNWWGLTWRLCCCLRYVAQLAARKVWYR